MLCGVFKSLPGASRKDASTTQEVLAKNHAADDAGYWSGAIWPKAALYPADSVAGKLRSEIDLLTGPYFVKGLRLLPSGLYMRAMEQGRRIIPQFNAAVQESAARLDEWIDLMKEKQNGMFRPDLYPSTPEQFMQMFKLELKVMPLPDQSNFLLVQLADEAINEVRQDYQRALDESLATHQQELFNRLMEPVLNMARILSRYESQEKKPKVYESLIGNVVQVVETLPHLNLAGNPKLEELRLLAAQMTEGLTTKGLKESGSVRLQTMAQADEILRRMKDYMP